MFFPYHVDFQMRRLPIVNLGIIAAVLLAYFSTRSEDLALLIQGIAKSLPSEVKSLFAGVWLHRDSLHLLGNILFLWIIGVAVCAEIGNAWYLLSYIVLSVGAGVGQWILAETANVSFVAEATAADYVPEPAIVGADGFITGIIVMFLIWYPTAKLYCLWVFFYFQRFKLNVFWIVPLWVILNVVRFFLGATIPLGAHLGGLVGGLLIGLWLLAIDAVKLDPDEPTLWDILTGKKKSPKVPVFAPVASGAGRTVRSDEAPLDDVHLTSLDPPTGYFQRFACSCGKLLTAPRKNAGDTMTCPACGNEVEIP